MQAKLISSLAAGILLATAATASSAGVTVSVGEPGFYGVISIGNAPAPVLINPQPVIIQQGPVVEPLYVRVRPNEQKNWRKSCRKYNACNRPVYFVDHGWYQNSYSPYYREHRAEYRQHDNRNNNHNRRYNNGKDTRR